MTLAFTNVIDERDNRAPFGALMATAPGRSAWRFASTTQAGSGPLGMIGKCGAGGRNRTGTG